MTVHWTECVLNPITALHPMQIQKSILPPGLVYVLQRPTGVSSEQMGRSSNREGSSAWLPHLTKFTRNFLHYFEREVWRSPHVFKLEAMSNAISSQILKVNFF